MFLPELLAPAGTPEKLHTALLYGADAVYLGGESHNLRAGGGGFGPAELAEGIRAARARSARVYYCLNSFPFEGDMKRLPRTIEEAASLGVDAFIVADPGVFRLVRLHAPSVPVHLSTQANTTNSEAVAFWRDQGVSRVNLARELTCRDIYSLRRSCPDMELEVFAHGAMCLAVSGQCLLSAWLNNRPANQGRCTHPCRFEYRGMAWSSPSLPGEGDAPDTQGKVIPQAMLTMEEALREGEPLWDVVQSEPFSTVWAPQDLCLVHYLPWFIRTGVASLKIEGRMKGSAYVAQVVDVYRTALEQARAAVYGEQADESEPDAVTSGGNGGGPRKIFHPEVSVAELLHTASRPLGTGFFLPGRRRNITEEFLRACSGGKMDAHVRPVLAKVLEPAGTSAWRVEVRGNWNVRQGVELILPGMRRPVLAAAEYGLENHRGEKSVSVGSGIRGVLHTDFPEIAPGVFIRAAVAGGESAGALPPV